MSAHITNDLADELIDWPALHLLVPGTPVVFRLFESAACTHDGANGVFGTVYHTMEHTIDVADTPLAGRITACNGRPGGDLRIAVRVAGTDNHVTLQPDCDEIEIITNDDAEASA